MFRQKDKDGTTRLTGALPLTLEDILDAAHPVGSYYTSDDPTDPGTLFVGTWVRVKGRFVVGLDEAQVEFDTVNETGGSKTENISHVHAHSHTHTQQDHVHNLFMSNNTSTGGSAPRTNDAQAGSPGTLTTSGPNVTNTSAGGSTALNNLPPYITCYMWKRTA